MKYKVSISGYIVSLFVVIILISPSAISFAEQPTAQDFFQQINKGLMKLHTMNYSFEYKYKPSDDDTVYTTTGALFMKRDSTDTIVKRKVRAHYTSGYVFTYSNGYYKSLDTNTKKCQIVDPSNSSYSWLLGNWISKVINISFPSEQIFKDNNDFTFAIDSSLYMLDSVPCFKFDIRYVQTKMVDLPPGIPQVASSRSEYYFGRKDFGLRKYKQVVNLTDSSKQITQLEIGKLRINPDLADNIFDLIAPKEYSTEIYQDKDRLKLLDTLTPAPDFTLKNEKGEDVKLSDFKGKLVMLDFWGTWCYWCLKAMPAIQKVYDKFKSKGFEILGISCQEKPKADPPAFMKKSGYKYKVLLKGEQVAQKYNVEGFPTFYLINKDGLIIHRHAGYMDDLEEYLSNIISNELGK